MFGVLESNSVSLGSCHLENESQHLDSHSLPNNLLNHLPNVIAELILFICRNSFICLVWQTYLQSFSTYSLWPKEKQLLSNLSLTHLFSIVFFSHSSSLSPDSALPVSEIHALWYSLDP